MSPEQFTAADGTTLRVLHSTADDARIAVVFVHGYAMDHRIWHRFTDTIADAVLVPIEVLAYDHRGHGESQLGGPANANIGRLADDLAELLGHAVHAERVVLVGHAMGGLVVTELAKRRPAMFARRVAGLVFLATPTDLSSETAQAVPMAAGRIVRE
ncbi:MAG: alpha/beta fold hydrolase, partial [Sciscionella sp.]|nr:alpha/beta fold hydrolase [Sciscionella sp.]